MFKKIISFSNLTLLVALSLSSVAAYYSIIGLTAIFAGAVIPVIIMGSILEVGKITTTVWLRKYWKRAGWLLKLYLVPAVIALALLTSMGIFGFLSKAHMEQGITSGDAQSKVAIYDEKIKTAKDNIDANRKALKQMDEAVDQVMARSTTETGADKAVAIRRSQQKERGRLLAEIEAEQKKVSSLAEERAPLASEMRKVEAEVGPIKYIAALIYGDNADQNMLESAVRWVIILLVVVFDPLAIALVLAANASKEWDAEEEDSHKPDAWVADVGPTGPDYEPDDGPLSEEQIEEIKEIAKEDLPTGEVIKKDLLFVDPGEHPKDNFEYEEKVPEPEVEKSILEQHPYLTKPFVHFTDMKPLVQRVEDPVEETVIKPVVEPVKELTVDSDAPILALGIDVMDRPGDYINADDIMTAGVTKEKDTPLREIDGDKNYVLLDGRHMHKDVAKSLRPDLFRITADSTASKSNFGTKFPELASKGDIFVRVDVLPNRVYKFDSKRWIEINKENTDTYLHNQEYVKHLVTMIESGQYDIDLLSDKERAEIEQYLRDQNT